MPHQCTNCGRAFDDGSKEMLSGCPDCGGNKFQFHPDGVDEEPETAEPPDPPEPAVDNSVARTVGNAATAVRDLVGNSPGEEKNPSTDAPTADTDTGGASREQPSRPTEAPSKSTGMAESENDAQASARSEVVSPDDLPSTTDQPAGESRSVTPDAPPSHQTAKEGDRPDLSELREELNQQFESIRVLNPGQYELNLMELYDREEYIVALQEDGKYTIQVPERWKD